VTPAGPAARAEIQFWPNTSTSPDQKMSQGGPRERDGQCWPIVCRWPSVSTQSLSTRSAQLGATPSICPVKSS
jgi:hypothetical protein